MTSEEFTEVTLPDSLAYHPWWFPLSMSKLRESLVVAHSVEGNGSFFGVWMMEDESFTKLFAFNVNTSRALEVKGFKKSGEAIVEVVENICRRQFTFCELIAYEPDSKHVDNLVVGIDGMKYSFSGTEVYNEAETLDFQELEFNNRFNRCLLLITKSSDIKMSWFHIGFAFHV
ncbi:hypothetical protein Hanom_Chr16g01510871 [Helianthus anomalus]